MEIPVKINVAGHHHGADDEVVVDPMYVKEDQLVLDIYLPVSFGNEVGLEDNGREWRIIHRNGDDAFVIS